MIVECSGVCLNLEWGRDKTKRGVIRFLSGCFFQYNAATVGGAIHSDSAKLEMKGCTFYRV